MVNTGFYTIYLSAANKEMKKSNNVISLPIAGVEVTNMMMKVKNNMPEQVYVKVGEELIALPLNTK